MNSAEIKVSYIDHMGTDRTVVNAARISFNTSKEELDERDVKLVDYLAKNEHLSPFEHCMLTVIVECPLYVRSQIHRHRTFAYNEVSRRYTADDLEFYLPPADDVRVQAKNNKQASEGSVEELTALQAQGTMHGVVQAAERAFHELLSMGVSREQARGILPQCLMTKFYQTGNLRNFAHFVRLREHAHAQREVQYVAEQIKAIMLDRFPLAAAALFRHAKHL